MRDFLHHFFVPRHSNNFRAKLLHHQSLLFAITILFLGSFLLSTLRTNFPQVLGNAIDISSEKLVLLTNQKRAKFGEPPLVLDERLSKAAFDKAQDMFLKNYWAHNTPDGKTPWVFIKNAGYTYIYAGENLARGFDSADSVVSAWMASTDHRDNLLSANYRNVGFAVMKGKLNGEETVLIVQMLGSTTFPSIASEKITFSNVLDAQKEVRSRPLIDSLKLSKNLSRGLVALFVFVLILDMIVVERKRIIRFVGHNLDHVLFLILIIFLVTILVRGAII